MRIICRWLLYFINSFLEFQINLLQIDLVPPELVTAWKHYYLSKFEQLNVVCFTSFPKDETERNRDPSKGVLKIMISVLFKIIIVTPSKSKSCCGIIGNMFVIENHLKQHDKNTWDLSFCLNWFITLLLFLMTVLSKRRRRKRCFYPVGPRALLEACERLWGNKSMYNVRGTRVWKAARFMM